MTSLLDDYLVTSSCACNVEWIVLISILLLGFSCHQYRTDSIDYWNGKTAFVFKYTQSSKAIASEKARVVQNTTWTPCCSKTVLKRRWAVLFITHHWQLSVCREWSRVLNKTLSSIFFQGLSDGLEQSSVFGTGTAIPWSVWRWIALAAATVRPVFSRNTNHEPVTATLHADIGQNTATHLLQSSLPFHIQIISIRFQMIQEAYARQMEKWLSR